MTRSRKKKEHTALSLQMSAQKLLERNETSSFNSHKPTHTPTTPWDRVKVLLQLQSGFTPAATSPDSHLQRPLRIQTCPEVA